MNTIDEDFMKVDAPSKPNDDQFADKFKSFIFSQNDTAADQIAKNYQQVVQTLR